jgi:hypothetical protein
MNWFKARFCDYVSSYGNYNQIVPVTVERATDSFVWIGGRRHAKRSTDYDQYFPTWDEAQAWLIERADEAVAYRREKLANAEDARAAILANKPSAPATVEGEDRNEIQ